MSIATQQCVTAQLAATAVCTILITTLCGCGGPLGRVDGKVTLKGQPVADADIVFQPEENPNTWYSGLSFEDGSYQLSYGRSSGLPVGRYTVKVTYYALKNGQPLPSGEEGKALRDEEKAVAKTVSFDRDISAGKNTLDFELDEAAAAQ